MMTKTFQASLPKNKPNMYATHTKTQQNAILLIQTVLQELKKPVIANRAWLLSKITEITQITPDTKQQRKHINYLIKCCQGPIVYYEIPQP